MRSGMILFVMGGLFLLLGYMGVPVAFAIIAGVLVATAFTPISFQSMVGQLFHGIDSETLLAIPFFLLVGELMSSANVVYRMIALAQALVGHLRGGLAQVVTLFSMFFAGISGSSAADVAVLSRTVAPEMDKERYDRAFTAALIASASTMANLIPPSIMAVVYGARPLRVSARVVFRVIVFHLSLFLDCRLLHTPYFRVLLPLDIDPLTFRTTDLVPRSLPLPPPCFLQCTPQASDLSRTMIFL